MEKTYAMPLTKKQVRRVIKDMTYSMEITKYNFIREDLIVRLQVMIGDIKFKD